MLTYVSGICLGMFLSYRSMDLYVYFFTKTKLFGLFIVTT